MYNNTRPRVLVSAYDISNGETPEGYIALKVLEQLSKKYNITVVTRCNNLVCENHLPNVKFIGFDFPKPFLFLKKRFTLHNLYSYFWHLLWPLYFLKKKSLLHDVKLIHHFNFHNDSLPSLSWILGKKIIWGPINHHEIIPKWRYEKQTTLFVLSRVKFFLRILMWKFDPFLALFKAKVSHFIIGGDWVRNRLSINNNYTIMSQLGVDEKTFFTKSLSSEESFDISRGLEINLLSVGRAVLIKGHVLAIDTLKQLPNNYTLTIVASGPELEKLKKHSLHKNIHWRVKFIERCSRQELNILFNKCHFFLFMSAEVAGLVWLEALASGCNVVTFDGSTEIVRAAKKLSKITVVKNSQNYNQNIKNLTESILMFDCAEKHKEALSPYYFSTIAERISKLYKLFL